MDLAAVRTNFRHLDRWIFLNHAGVSPLPRPVVEAMKSFLDAAAENAGENDSKWAKREVELRNGLSTVLNCSASEIALVKNTSEGISIVANGIHWQPGDNVIICNVEFPANVYPWLALERKGVEVRFVRERADGRITADDVRALIDDRTRAVSLSLVQFASGFRIPAEEIGELCRKRGVLFVLDAFQAVGALRVDAQALQADAIASAFHKWLLGPEGIGFLYVRGEAMEKIAVSEWGWKSVTVPYTSFDYRLDPRPDASRYECGTLNTAGICGAAAAVDFYLQAGISEVENRLIELTDWLCGRLTERGCRVFSPRGEKEKSGIVCFEHPGRSTDEIVRELARRRVSVRKRAGRVRVAPHYYNTEEELEAVLSVLPGSLR
ncbi:MAG: aminotransferase class V-fold PLP-dependent enzyme [Armatimonadota bacterium]